MTPRGIVFGDVPLPTAEASPSTITTQLSGLHGLVGPREYASICAQHGVPKGTVRILLDGADVTERCRTFDDREGWVLANYVDAHETSVRREYGKVTLVVRYGA